MEEIILNVFKALRRYQEYNKAIPKEKRLRELQSKENELQELKEKIERLKKSLKKDKDEELKDLEEKIKIKSEIFLNIKKETKATLMLEILEYNNQILLMKKNLILTIFEAEEKIDSKENIRKTEEKLYSFAKTEKEKEELDILVKEKIVEKIAKRLKSEKLIVPDFVVGAKYFKNIESNVATKKISRKLFLYSLKKILKVLIVLIIFLGVFVFGREKYSKYKIRKEEQRVARERIEAERLEQERKLKAAKDEEEKKIKKQLEERLRKKEETRKAEAENKRLEAKRIEEENEKLKRELEEKLKREEIAREEEAAQKAEVARKMNEEKTAMEKKIKLMEEKLKTAEKKEKTVVTKTVEKKNVAKKIELKNLKYKKYINSKHKFKMVYPFELVNMIKYDNSENGRDFISDSEILKMKVYGISQKDMEKIGYKMSLDSLYKREVKNMQKEESYKTSSIDVKNKKYTIQGQKKNKIYYKYGYYFSKKKLFVFLNIEIPVEQKKDMESVIKVIEQSIKLN